MKAIVRGFAAAVRRFPIAIVIGVVVLTAVLGSFASQVQIATGNEGFAPDNAEIAAQNRIRELFGSEQQSVFQVIVRQPGGNVISAEGARTVAAVEDAIQRVAGDQLSSTPQRPGVVSYLDPVIQGAAMQGIPLDQLDDGTVGSIYQAALGQMPAEQKGLVTGLLSKDGDPASASTSAGLVLAFFQSDTTDATAALEAQSALEQSISTELDKIDTSLEIRPFSFALLFGGIDSFTNEVGRLFAMAGLIIVAILMFVYWVRPRGSPGPAIRRTVADMVLTMVTIFMAIGMMQGTGVLLEKAGIISAFSAPTQIVPILMIGLGVDYAIHLISRYREEVGEGDSVDGSMSLSIGTVGVALVLATLTTVIGFLTNVANPVPALADFGILSAVGIFYSFLLMMTFVPAFRVLLDRRAERSGRLPVQAMGAHSERVLPQVMGRLAVIAERVPSIAIVVALVLGGLGYWGFTQLETRFSFTDFLPEDSPAVQTLDILTEDFGGGFGEQTQVLIEAPQGGTLATGAYHNLMVDASSRLGQYDTVSTFETAQGPVANASSPVSVLQQLFAGGPASAPPAVLAAAQQVGLGPDLKVPEDADVTPLYMAVEEAAPDQMDGAAHFSDGRMDAALFDIRTTAG
ncbi:MAG: MMPL family transporter, partial [Acidimicrobiia bacterium]